MSRACVIGGLFLIWASVAAITLGTHLQTLSPRFAEYEQQKIRSEAGSGGEERLNPAGRMALVLSFTWEFVFCFSGLFAALFTAGVLVIRAMGRWHRDLALLTAGGFGMGCLAGAVEGVGEALRSFDWGFEILGSGYLLSAAGLAIGAVGVVGSILAPNKAQQQPGHSSEGFFVR